MRNCFTLEGEAMTMDMFLQMARQLDSATNPSRLPSKGDFEEVYNQSSYYRRAAKNPQSEVYGQEKLGITSVAPDNLLELRPNFSEADLQVVLRTLYKQVFGNTYVLESERPIYAESLLRNGSISVREFIRLLGKSELYRERFFRSTSNNRFIELNLKHFLGRAPYNQQEISFHFNLYCTSGYEAEIDSYLDSTEYKEAFGESIVPYFRGFKYQVNQTAAAFPRMITLFGGDANSDTDRNKNGQKTELTKDLAKQKPPVLFFSKEDYTAAPESNSENRLTIDASLGVWLLAARELLSSNSYELKLPEAVSEWQRFMRPSSEARSDAYAQEKIGITSVAPDNIVELRTQFTEADLQSVFKAAYKQVFGNTYILEHERLVSAESQLRNGYISVREFVRMLGKSELYKDRFFFSTSNNRFIELNCKHFLGRALYSQSEIAQHLDRYHTQGYDVEIDSYIDSDEYCEAFGENIVPYFRGFKYQVNQPAAAFDRLIQLYGGDAGSDTDRAQNGQQRKVQPEELLRSGRGIL
jgi:hypothetical protein